MKASKAGGQAWGAVGWEFHKGGSWKVLLKVTQEQEGNEGVTQLRESVLDRINRTYKGPPQNDYIWHISGLAIRSA